MKVSIKTAAILIVLCICYTGVYAQAQRQSIAAHWGVAVPINNQFIDKAGAVNPSLEWSYRIIPSLSAGLSLGYGSFIEKGAGDERIDTDLISGNREKSLSLMPFLAKFHYFPFGNRNRLFSPFIGVGVGVQYAKFYIIGDAISSNKTSNWAEAFSAEMGAKIQLPKNERIYFDIRGLWQYGGNSCSLTGTKPIQTLGITLGVGFKF